MTGMREDQVEGSLVGAFKRKMMRSEGIRRYSSTLNRE